MVATVTVTRGLDLRPREVGTQCNRSGCDETAEHRVHVEGEDLPGLTWDYYFCTAHKDTPVA
jgi:hypothetical protein